MEKIEKNKPLLSIIIASYNMGNIIEEALNSIINQKFNNWECIIVDGGSNDNTLSLIKEYSSKDYRIKYLSEPDKGIYDAFNKGWKIASGIWCYYLGADDILLDTGFYRIFKNDLNKYDIIYGNVIYKTPIGLKSKKSHKNVFSVKRKLNCSHQGFIMRRQIIESNLGFDRINYQICADYDLILRSFLNGAKMKYIDEDIAIFNVCGTSGTIRMIKECYQIRRNLNSINFIYNYLAYVNESMIYYLRWSKYKVAIFFNYLNTKLQNRA